MLKTFRLKLAMECDRISIKRLIFIGSTGEPRKVLGTNAHSMCMSHKVCTAYDIRAFPPKLKHVCMYIYSVSRAMDAVSRAEIGISSFYFYYVFTFFFTFF